MKWSMRLVFVADVTFLLDSAELEYQRPEVVESNGCLSTWESRLRDRQSPARGHTAVRAGTLLPGPSCFRDGWWNAASWAFVVRGRLMSDTGGADRWVSTDGPRPQRKLGATWGAAVWRLLPPPPHPCPDLSSPTCYADCTPGCPQGRRF